MALLLDVFLIMCQWQRPEKQNKQMGISSTWRMSTQLKKYRLKLKDTKWTGKEIFILNTTTQRYTKHSQRLIKQEKSTKPIKIWEWTELL